MYATFGNQMYHILHFLFAFTLLLVIYPRLLFPKLPSDGLEQFLGNFLRVVPLLIVIGYVLVLTKLFEFLAITPILILLVINRMMSKRSPSEREETSNKWTVRSFDYFEGLINVKNIGVQKLKDANSKSIHGYRKLVASIPRMLTLGLILFIVILAAYIRFYDAFRSPVPGMSDGNVTLEFMKFIDKRTLFPQGFYPSGLYIILDTIFKYADIDSIYVLKYMGPTCIMLVLAGIYFVVSRLTGNKYAGIISAIGYGLLSPLFAGGSYDRQAATNSQEFAFIFVFPTLYFYLSYLQTGNRNRLWTAAAGTLAVGFVHGVSYAWLGMGMGLLLLLHIVLNGRRDFDRAVYVCAAGIAASIAASIPYLMSKLMNVKVHSSTGKYLVNRLSNIESPLMTTFDQIALAAAFVVLLQGLLQRGDRPSRFPYLFGSLFVFCTFFVYYYVGPLTKLEVVSVRSQDIWVLCIPFIVGMCWHSLLQVFRKYKRIDSIQLGLCMAIAVASITWVPVKPIVPYKMEWDASVEQYLRIASEYKPMQFLIASPRVQEYAIVLGTGNHMYLGSGDPHLLDVYDPTKAPHTRYGENKHASVAPDIFIYYEKNIFPYDSSIASIEKTNFERYSEEYPKLLEWINEYRQAHQDDDSFSIYYEDENLTIFHLHREVTRDEVVEKIFG